MIIDFSDGITNPIYVQFYYYNTLTRGASFVVGMVFGYLLHTYRGKKLKISKVNKISEPIEEFTMNIYFLLADIVPVQNKSLQSFTGDTLKFLTTYIVKCSSFHTPFLRISLDKSNPVSF